MDYVILIAVIALSWLAGVISAIDGTVVTGWTLFFVLLAGLIGSILII